MNDEELREFKALHAALQGMLDLFEPGGLLVNYCAHDEIVRACEDAELAMSVPPPSEEKPDV